MAELKSIVNQKFGKLTVIELDHIEEYISPKGNRHNKFFYKCLCECGNTVIVEKPNLVRGFKKSCGCMRAKISFPKSKKLIHRLQRIWNSMIQRCTNPKRDSYYLYGARGITVCAEWRKFINFYNWALKNGYRDDLSIDRINGNGNYEPSNCRWVTKKEQQRNRKNNVYLTFNGETHCIAEWAEIVKISKCNLFNRIKKLHWSVDRALTEGVRSYAN